MKKSCSFCGRIHAKEYECPHRPRSRKRGSAAVQIRNTKKWQTTRESVRERDQNLCVACLANDCITYHGLEVHHIVPLEEQPELAFDMSNLITLCRKHHEAAELGKLSRRELREMIPPEGVELEISTRPTLTARLQK